MAIKTGEDLIDNPIVDESDEVIPEIQPDDTPFSKGFELLSKTEGESLEIMTRMTPEISKAGSIALAHRRRFPHNPFITDLYEQIERHAVSVRGEGRKEVSVTVQAFAGAQASYYDADAEKSKSDDKTSFIQMNEDKNDS